MSVRVSFLAYTEDQYNSGSEPLKKGDTLTSFRGEDFTYEGCYHSRKVTVRNKEGALRDYYANVFNLGIWDKAWQGWSFYPEWNPVDSTAKSDI
jgi:hypothetical protein